MRSAIPASGGANTRRRGVDVQPYWALTGVAASANESVINRGPYVIVRVESRVAKCRRRVAAAGSRNLAKSACRSRPWQRGSRSSSVRSQFARCFREYV